VLWVESPVRISRHLRIRRWRYLTGDSGLLLGTTAFMMLVANGDYLIVGYFCGSEAVGIFYFAFNLSMQTLALLMVNLANVLFPALSKLQAERPRQIEAYLRASRVFAAIAVPFCLMQAAGSDAGFRLIFKPIWYPSIPVLQILSVAMAIRTTAIPAQALTAAQNRLRYSLNIAVAYSIVFLAIVALAARFGGPHAVIWVALAELVHFGITDPLYMYLLMRMNGRGVREVFHVFKAPLIAGSIAALIAGGVSHVFPAGLSRSWQLPRLLAVVCVMVVVYVPLLRLLSAELWQELVERVRALRAKA
ncbi:MAG TPA: oligosaccharide flippase family protein, partial [Tepidisphaeraceae bacterium]|nr:oligosaccharide flippase family protein [Tepidisphaeraceae bacterium]